MKYLIILSALLFSCANQQPISILPVPTPVEIPAEEKPKPIPPAPVINYAADWPQKQYTEFAAKALKDLGKDLLSTNPLDVDYYCDQSAPQTAWKKTDKTAFWIMTISALSRFESSFNTNATYVEDFNDAQGKKVISRGLLQISQESANGYGCGITNPQMLHDPETNIRCGVRIMNRWVVRDKAMASNASPWKGIARYWSPFRKADRKVSIRLKTRTVCKV